MHILVIGLNHETAPAETRERLYFRGDQLSVALARLTALVREGVILSTCHRTEVYALVENGVSDGAMVVRFLADCHGLPTDAFSRYLYIYADEDAVRHLFSVASGMNSAILGEPQILGQVREAFQAAVQHRTVAAVLSALFRRAVHTGRDVRTTTDIGRHALSTGHAAAALAAQASQPLPLSERRVLLIGAGSMGKMLVSLLLKAGVRTIHVANRTVERAVTLAQRAQGQGWGLEAVERLLAEVDLVINTAEVEHPLITAPMVAAARAQAGSRPLVLIDLGMPRGIDSAVRKSEGVVLYDVDDLRPAVEETLARQRCEADEVQEIIAQETAAFMAWFRSLEVVPTIVALRRKLEEIRIQELQQHASRFGALSEAQQAEIAMLTTRIINKILHQPTVQLKECAGQQQGHLYADALRDLFALELE